MNKKITKSLIVLGIIVFSFVISNSAFARYNPYDSSYWLEPVSYNSIEDYNYSSGYYGNQGYQQGYYQQYQSYNTSNNYPGTTQTTTKPSSSVVNNYYYQSAPTKTTTTEKVVTNTNTGSNYRDTTNNGGEGYYNGLGASAAGYNITNGVTALSLRGSGSFMPSSIWQWLLVIILILAIIVVSRMIYHRRMVAEEIHHGPAH